MRLNKIMAVVLFSAILVTLVQGVSAYCWSTSITPQGNCRIVCDFSKCNYAQCLAEPMPWNCAGGGDVDVTPPVMNVFSPLDASYDSSTILVDVTTDETVPYIKLAQRGDSYSSLCTNCNHGTRIIYRVPEGTHTWKFLTKDYDGNIVVLERTFTVDFTPPKITSVSPPNNFYFSRGINTVAVKYTENDPKSIKFYYRPLGSVNPFIAHTLAGCPSGKDQTCTGTPNINYAEGTKVEYYFEIKDASFTTTSDTYVSTIDTAFLAQPVKIYSPLTGVYDKASQLLDVDVIKQCEAIYMILDGKSTRLCSNCNKYTGTKYFRDGMHTLVINATCGLDQYLSSPVSLELDTKKPRIMTTLPKIRSYANGDFSVKYTEANVKDVTLVYGTDTLTRTVHRTCPSGTSVTCLFDGINLAEFDNQEITYYFTVSDSINTVSSRPVSVMVDFTKPVITKTAPADGSVSDKRTVPFSVGVSEKVKKLAYTEDGMRVPRTLCSNCDSYDRLVSLPDGQHDLTLIATDYAGNEGTLDFSIFVDSRAPIMYPSEPGYRMKYSDGMTFTAYYAEQNPVELVLYVNGTAVATKSDCPPQSTKGDCTIVYDVSSMNAQTISYYFTMEDIAGRIESSTPKNVEVDSVAPVLTVTSPTATTYTTNYVPFEVSASEQVTMKYIYDGRITPLTLCTRCTSYNGNKYFRDGSYTVTITAEDKAGRTDSETVSFNVV